MRCVIGYFCNLKATADIDFIYTGEFQQNLPDFEDMVITVNCGEVD